MKKNIFIGCLLLLCCCNSEKQKIDTKNSDIQIKIERFDLDFWQQNTIEIKHSMELLYKKYPHLLPLYTEQSLMVGQWNSEECHEILTTHFFTDSTIQMLYSDCVKQYANVDHLEQTLTEVFQKANFYFPEKTIPKISFHVSAGANPTVLLYKDSLISLSIDNYLGENYPLYANVYSYLRYNMRKEKVAPDITTIWIVRNFPFIAQSGQLLDEMIYRGKVMYLLSLLLPEESNSNLMGYTPKQWTWCVENEKNMWMLIVEGKHLFSTEGLLITKYLNDAPFTSYFSQESPGRCGVFIGWRIVESYMKNNPNISVADLMKNTNYRLILEKSRYKP